MKVLPSSLRLESAEDSISLGGDLSNLSEKRHFKEIIMNGEVSSNDTIAEPVQKDGDAEKAVPAAISNDIASSKDANGHSENENEEPKAESETVEKKSDDLPNGVAHEAPKNAEADSFEKELPQQEAAPVNGEVAEEKKEEEKEIQSNGTEIIELEKEEPKIVAATKEADDASSTEDEDIKLVLDDALDEIEKEEAEVPPVAEVKKTSGTKEKAALPECLSDEAGISLDNVTSNFDDDSCSSFDKSLEEIQREKEKTEDKEDKIASSNDTSIEEIEYVTEKDASKKVEKAEIRVEKMDTESVAEKPGELTRKRSIDNCEPEVVEAKKSKPDDIKEVEAKKRKADEPEEVVVNKSQPDPDEPEEVEAKKVKPEELDDFKETKLGMTKLKSTVKQMSRKELEKFIVDTFLVNMTRRSQMAVQEQELTRMNNRCEAYKKSLASVTKLCSDLKSTVAQISDTNRNSAKIIKPKTIVRHVAIQVPSKTILPATSQPEKKLRTLPPVQRIPTNTTAVNIVTSPRNARLNALGNTLGRPPSNGRPVMIHRPGQTVTYPAPNQLIATLKSPPKSTQPSSRTASTGTLSTTESPVTLMQSGGRLIIPTTTAGSKTPVAYIISNSKTQPMLMQNGVGGLMVNKSNSNGPIPGSGRSPNIISQQRPVHQPTIPNVPMQSRQVVAVRTRMATKPTHPSPLPLLGPQQQRPGWKALPPKPTLKIQAAAKGIMLSWHLPTYTQDHEEIKSYQIYAYQETAEEPDSKLWKTVGDVKALALPMACTLTQFKEGYKYHFSVRAVDVHNRMGISSDTMSIILQKTND